MGFVDETGRSNCEWLKGGRELGCYKEQVRLREALRHASNASRDMCDRPAVLWCSTVFFFFFFFRKALPTSASATLSPHQMDHAGRSPSRLRPIAVADREDASAANRAVEVSK